MSAMLALAVLALLVSQSPPAQGAPTIRGMIVDESTGKAIAHAIVLVDGIGKHADPAETDDAGQFTVSVGPRCSESGATANRGTDFLRIQAPGFSELRVDPCSQAPWADPIPLRRSATLRGRIAPGPLRRRVSICASSSDLSWPPQSGLYGSDGFWTADADTEGAFEFPSLPAQVALTLAVGVSSTAGGWEGTKALVLQPAERREIVLDVGMLTEPVMPDPGFDEVRWIPISLSAVDADGRARLLPWFEVIGGSRPIQHENAGGRLHMHKFRACNDLEVRVGATRLIARDVAGWVGVQELTVPTDGAPAIATVALVPGALLRLDATRLTEGVRASIEVGGKPFAERELLAGVVRYEVVPQGAIRIRLRQASGSAWEKSLQAGSSMVNEVTLSR